MYSIPNSDLLFEEKDGKIILYRDTEKGIEYLVYKNKIKFNNNVYTKNIDWVKWICKYKFVFTIEDDEIVKNMVFVPYKSKAKFERNFTKLPIFNKAIEIIKDGIVFRIIPRYYRYAISKEGLILDRYNNLEIISVKPYYSGDYKYPCYNIYDYARQSRTSIPAHRLVALAWVNNGDYINNNIVDHIDNNKANYNADNLQWISESRNQTRTKYPNGYAFEVRNIDTGEITGFYSQHDFFNWNNGFKVNFGKDFSLLRYGKKYKLKKGNFEIKPTSDKRDWWFKNNKEEYKLPLNTFGKGLEVKDIDTGEVFSGSVYDLIEKTNLSKAGLYKFLYLGVDYRVIRNYIIRKKSDLPWPNTPDLVINTSKCVYVENILTKEITKYDSIRQAFNTLGTSGKTVAKYLDTDKPFIINNQIVKFWSSSSRATR